MPIVLEIAAEIIRNSNREKAADTILRETLRTRRGLSPVVVTEISHAVFTYYRWRGWLANVKGVEAGIERAQELAERFRQNPFSLPVADLRSKAVPAWAHSEVRVSDEWLRSLQREPRLWLRAKRGQGRTVAKALGLCKRVGNGMLADSLEYTGHKDLFRTAEFHAGDFELQDISSQAVGFICEPKPGETWWDACAGEGGKLLHFSELMENKGLIWASDRAAWRLQKLKRRTARAKVYNYRAALWDGGQKLPTRTQFDGVLVDAPCSGVGTWQRNPHARWTTTPDDVKELAAIQKQLLINAAAAVKPGGKLIYAVCTLTVAETESVTDYFETTCKEFGPVLTVNPLAPAFGPGPGIWLWPQNGGGNGMFVAAWRRNR